MPDAGPTAFEVQVARVLRHKGYVNVQHNVSINGKQVDVYGEYPTPVGVLPCIVECKMHAERIGIDEVERFSGLLSRLSHIHHGFLVSTSGFTDKAKELAAEGHPRLRLSVFSEFASALIDFSTLIEEVQRSWDSDVISQCYIDPQVERRGGGDQSPSQLSHVFFEWLNGPGSQPLAVLGGYGTGKSSFCRWAASEVAARFDKGEIRRVPVVVNLAEFTKSMRIEQVLTDLLVNRYDLRNASFRSLQAMNEAGLILFFFDGFDEMAKRVDEEVTFANLDEILKLVVPGSKVVLTCRKEYFHDYIRERMVLAGSPRERMDFTNRPEFVRVEVNLFSDEMLSEFLRRRVPLLDAPKDWEFYLNEIRSIHNLIELAHRPVLAEMIVSTLPQLLSRGISINHAELYHAYTRQELKRQTAQKGRDLLLTTDRRFELVAQLARLMFTRGWNQAHYSQIAGLPDGSFGDGAKVAVSHRGHDFLTCSFLANDAQGNYRFSHRSFLEFFVAVSVGEELARQDAGVAESIIGLTPEILDFFVALKGSREIATVLSALASSSAASPVLRRQALHALGVVGRSRYFDWPEARPILEHTKVSGIQWHQSARRLEWRYIEVSDSDLSSAVLEDAQLKSCTLRNVRMFRARLRDVKLEGTELSDLDVTEGILDDVVFTDCRIRRLQGARSRVSRVEFRRSPCTGLEANRARIRNLRVLESPLRDIDIEAAAVEGLHVDRSPIEGVRFRAGTLMDSVLGGPLIKDALCEGLETLRVEFRGDLVGVDLALARLRETILPSAHPLDRAVRDAMRE